MTLTPKYILKVALLLTSMVWLTATGVIASDDLLGIKKTDQFEILEMPVYPFEALLADRSGTVLLGITVDVEGNLLGVDILEGDAAEFDGAALAYGYASKGKTWRKLKRESPTQYELPVEFDASKHGAPIHPMSTPSDSAMEILKKLKKDRNWKGYTSTKRLDEKLAIVSQTAPIFPVQLQDTVAEGRAVIEFYIDKKGFPILPRVVSATDPAFGYSACQAVSMWKFKPPMTKGKPTVVKVRIPVNFKLNQ